MGTRYMRREVRSKWAVSLQLWTTAGGKRWVRAGPRGGEANEGEDRRRGDKERRADKKKWMRRERREKKVRGEEREEGGKEGRRKEEGGGGRGEIGEREEVEEEKRSR